MPSKIQLDENLWFLFICLQKSDYKSIDFNAVGRATSLKAPAARMRYTRLRRQIEGGLLMDSDGVPFGHSKKSDRTRLKRKAAEQASKPDEAESDLPQSEEVEKKIKVEDFISDDSDMYETDSDESDSEDDKPQAKRRGALGGGAERFVLGTTTRVRFKCKEEHDQMALLPDCDIDMSDSMDISDNGNPAVPVIESPIIKAEPFADDELMSIEEDLPSLVVQDGVEQRTEVKRQSSVHPSPLATTLPTPPTSSIKRNGKSKSKSPLEMKSEGDGQTNREGPFVKKLFRNPWVQYSVADRHHAATRKGELRNCRVSRSV